MSMDTINEQVTDTTDAPRPSWLRRHRLLTGLAVGALVLGAAAGIATAGGGGSFIAHGTEEVCVDAADITVGTQVTVTDSAGKVIGTGTLVTDNSATAVKLVQEYDQLQASLGVFGDSSSSYASIYDFTATVPGGESRYGISIGQNRGTIYFSEQQMRSGPGLSLGC